MGDELEVRGIGDPVAIGTTPCEEGGSGEGPPEGPDLALMARGIVRRARWGVEVGRAWEDELNARMAATAYQRRMSSVRSYEEGLVNKDAFEKEWGEVEAAMEAGIGRRRALMRDFVSHKVTHLRTQDGGRQPVYAAMAARHWVGERGASEIIAASGFLYQPVLKQDQAGVLADVQQRFRAAVAAEMQKRLGLTVYPSSPSLDRIEWLVIWEVDDQTVTRIRSFEQGWSGRPEGLDKPASQFGAADVRRLASLHGFKIRPHRGTPLPAADREEELEPTADDQEWKEV